MNKISPGANYEVKENKYKNSPKIAFGYRRQQNNIFACGCTSDVVGPGSYNGKINTLRFFK